MDPTVILRLKRLITESACSEIETTNGILRLFFGQRNLAIQSAWRVILNSDIVVASGDPDPGSCTTAATILIGAHVEEVSVESPYSDLIISFTGGAVVRSFADTEKYEHWNFWISPLELIVGGPGRLWSSF